MSTIRRAWPSCWRRSALAGRVAPKDADLVILNTCHIREKAAEKVFSELGSSARLKAAQRRAAASAMIDRRRRLRRPGRGRRDPAPRAVCRYGLRAADLSPVAGNGGARIVRPAAAVVDTSFPAEPKFDHLPQERSAAGGQRASDGAGRLRQVLHVLRRALHPRRRVFAPGRADPRRGAPARRRRARARSRCSGRTSTPITARAPTGGNGVSAIWCAPSPSIPGLDRIRYTTSHPRDVDDGLIAAHRDVPQLMPFLHLPVQSGSTACWRR